MELLFALTPLLILAVIAPRWGYDSRATLYSDEQRLAFLGLVWVTARRGCRDENGHA